MIVFLVIVFLVLLIIVHELGHFLAAKLFKVRVEEFGIGFPPRLWIKKAGETVYSFNALPLGGFVKLFGENISDDEKISEEEKQSSFQHQPSWKRAVVMFAGTGMNFIAGWLIISSIFMLGIPPGLAISQVVTDSPAESAGFKVNDFILAVSANGASVLEPKTPDEFVNFVKKFRGQELLIAVNRAGQTVELKAVPRIDAAENEGALGIAVVQKGIEKLYPPAAIYEGLKTAASISYLIAAALGQMLVGAFSGQPVLENLVGPIGIFGIAVNAGQIGIIYLLQLVALISLNLMVINLIPLVPFDGGKLLFIIIEKIKGSALSLRTEQTATAIGIALIIPLFIVVIVRDIIKFF